MFFTKYWRKRLQDVDYKSHTHTDTIPRTVQIARKDIIKGRGLLVYGPGSSWYDVDKTHEDINIEDAIKMIVDHLELKYEDGQNITPRLVKPRKEGLCNG